ncbi:MAG: SGNH/GDSL hydrolase family protein [Planctomycetota bacterium]|nr:SGNH/GDSL hydrolase family protein [Planctomycetota bacterium]MDA1165848.1 SGNH/GDSL hydrolase family protein [Planctomycetota bacterium]
MSDRQNEASSTSIIFPFVAVCVQVSNMMLRGLLTAITLLACVQHSLAGNHPGELRLTLPEAIYAVVDVEMNVYFDNIVLSESPESYQFEIQCAVGRSEDRRWNLTAAPDDIGRHAFVVTIKDANDVTVANASSEIYVVPANSGSERKLKLLIVGDSLTHATLYPNELARLLSQPGNPTWKMLGTHRPTNAATGVAHEGYGGWTWERFVTKYEPEPDGTYRKRSSPFVFLNQDGKPELDVTRYFAETSDGQHPDVVFFLLGINDCFGANPDDPHAIDARIDSMLLQAETLLTAFHKAVPDADLAIGVTTPPNAREAGFEANYKGRYHRWGWKRIQHRLVERLLKLNGEHESVGDNHNSRRFIVPTHLNLDPLDGYPENNGVHPNAVGYRQIGVSIYSWLKWRQLE